MARPKRLSSEEIDLAFRDAEMRRAYGPILSPRQFARLFSVSVNTVYTWIAKGKLDGAVTRVGKHRRIWRNRAIEILFNRGKPKTQANDTNQPGDQTNDPSDE